MKFKPANTLDFNEQKAVKKVLKTGILSKFVADPNNALNGGYYVQKFENNLKKYFKVKHAITVNSWTSGLVTIIGAIGIENGDEVILSPWTMSACLSSILVWGGVPIFADIDKKTFCIDPKQIEKKITKKTKAIMAIDIFGQSSDIEKINLIAKKKNITVISDTAQAIGSKYNGKFSGTLTDIGGFSFNYHKHIHTGEGGVIVTNNPKFAKKCRLIRNHAEVTNKFKKKKDLINMIGYNFRMTEIEAAIGIEQLKKLNYIVKKKQKLAFYLKRKLKNLKGLQTPYVKKGCTHSYYAFPLIYSEEKNNVSRDKIFKELIKYKVPIKNKYVNLLELPLFRKKTIFDLPQFSSYKKFKKKNIYNFKQCPVVLNLNKKEYMCINLCLYDYSLNDMKRISSKFYKVWKKFKLGNQ